jgi:hypothetical protein
MPSGPSKEELEMYWKTSRNYFDELAKYYKTADPAYYNRYIAPYYSNPFSTGSASQNSPGAKKLFIVIAVFILVFTSGIAAFLFISTEKGGYDNSGDNRQVDIPKEEKSISGDKELEKYLEGDDFIVGSKFLAEKDYDKAEEHFKKIKPGDKNYKSAQQLLESIKYLRKYDKK